MTQLATFTVDKLLFGIDVREVQEVIRYQEMTRVPLAAPTVRGLINLRGQILTAIDMRRRLHLPDRDNDTLPMNVVLHTNDGAVSLLVDAIGDVVEVERSQFEPTPDTLSDSYRQIINGVYKLKGQLLLLLDTSKAVALS